jgi:hypothetical protein
VDDKQDYILVVRGPAQDLLYEHFSRLFEGRDGVVVIKDRRREDRRRHPARISAERRRHERRGRGPAWVVPPD